MIQTALNVWKQTALAAKMATMVSSQHAQKNATKNVQMVGASKLMDPVSNASSVPLELTVNLNAIQDVLVSVKRSQDSALAVPWATMETLVRPHVHMAAMIRDAG